MSSMSESSEMQNVTAHVVRALAMLVACMRYVYFRLGIRVRFQTEQLEYVGQITAIPARTVRG